MFTFSQLGPAFEWALIKNLNPRAWSADLQLEPNALPIWPLSSDTLFPPRLRCYPINRRIRQLTKTDFDSNWCIPTQGYIIRRKSNIASKIFLCNYLLEPMIFSNWTWNRIKTRQIYTDGPRVTGSTHQTVDREKRGRRWSQKVSLFPKSVNFSWKYRNHNHHS